jgi:hypothetical protein
MNIAKIIIRCKKCTHNVNWRKRSKLIDMPCSFCHNTGVMHVAEDTESSGTWVAFNIVAASLAAR